MNAHDVARLADMERERDDLRAQLAAVEHWLSRRAAALSAAPQPEPDVRAAYSESLRDEPARCEHLSSGQHWSDGWCDQARGYPGPTASGTPDGGQR